jgi:hypothetical protein
MTQSHGAESTLKTRVTVNDLLPSDDEYEKQRQSLCILLSEALFGEASDDILFGVAVRELWHWYNICFPSHTVKASQFASIFDQTKPLNIHFSSTTFNTSYASEGIFNRYSAAIVYLLVQGIKSHAREPNLLNRVLGFCGVARAALDLVSNKKTLTDFGKLVEPNNYLQEEWQQYPEGYRLFLITNFNSIQVDPELFVDSKLFDRARGPVKHSPQGYLDASPFFGVLCISANNGILDTEALLKFIYYFARSSTFSRGQATMGEWITSALLILSHLQMQLCSFTTHEVLTLNDIYRSHPEEVITVLCKNMSTLTGRLSH